MTSTRLIFGCGYLGRRAAAIWRESGDRVFALTRSREHARELQRLGVEPLVGDVRPGGALPELPEAATVLFAIGYDRQAGGTIHDVYVSGLARVLKGLPAATGELIYVSSVGVYSQTGGEWVNEDSLAAPTRAGGIACLAAEELLRASRFGARSLTLRAGGIYGPGRIPRRAEIEAGEPLDAPPHGYLNLIHVDDLAAIVVAAAERGMVGLYTATDSHPVLRSDYYGELARLLEGPPPRFLSEPSATAAAERGAADKRVSSERLFRDCPMHLRYPDYRAGLAAILAAEKFH